MARPFRMESEGGVYHVINRGNYQAPIFQSDRTKAAFLKCLAEACAKTGWLIHAWCLMSNHYHFAVSTPRANLVEGMQWLGGTFAGRFNGLRRKRGHLFQGRYKSLVVDPDEGLGPVCHYIHLNPVRAHLQTTPDLANYPWTSLRWLRWPKTRPVWYDPQPVLAHAGGLADTPHGRDKYLNYLAWLAEDEPARKQQQFDRMSKGWIIGTVGFAQTMIKENQALIGQGRRLATELREAREMLWQEELARLMNLLGRPDADRASAGKSVGWKVAVAVAMKVRTTATNRWLGVHLNMGGLHEVSRQTSAWRRQPDPELAQKLGLTTNYKA